jgi:hypothetical protein
MRLTYTDDVVTRLAPPTLHNLTRTLPANLLGRGVGANVGPNVGGEFGASVSLNVGCAVGVDDGRMVGTGWREDRACESRVYRDCSVRRYRLTDMHTQDKSPRSRRLTKLNHDRWNGWKAERWQSRYYRWLYYYWAKLQTSILFQMRRVCLIA